MKAILENFIKLSESRGEVLDLSEADIKEAITSKKLLESLEDVSKIELKKITNVIVDIVQEISMESKISNIKLLDILQDIDRSKNIESKEFLWRISESLKTLDVCIQHLQRILKCEYNDVI